MGLGDLKGSSCEYRVGKGTYEEKISPKNAFSLPMSGSVFVNSVCALA